MALRLLCFLAVVAVLSTPAEAASKPKRKKIMPRDLAAQYETVHDLWADLASRWCRARLAARPNREKTCNLFTAVVRAQAQGYAEQLGGMHDASPQSIVADACRPANLIEFRDLIVPVIESIMYMKTVKPDDISGGLSKMMQFVLNVITKNKSQMEQFSHLPPDALKGLRRRGINIPEVDEVYEFDMDEILYPEEEYF